ncbi:PH domain-containing protein [Dermabacteraceae bacterium P13136]
MVFNDSLSGIEVTQIDQRIIKARYLAAAIWSVPGLVVVVLCVLAGAFWGWWWMYPVAVALLALMVLNLVLIPRQSRVCGYAVREDDVVYVSGRLFREVEIVPLGRIQTVNFTEGPIERRYGLASLDIATASSNLNISGLPVEEARRLRSDILQRSRSVMAAL